MAVPLSIANDVNNIVARMKKAMPADLAYAHYTDNVLRVLPRLGSLVMH